MQADFFARSRGVWISTLVFDCFRIFMCILWGLIRRIGLRWSRTWDRDVQSYANCCRVISCRVLSLRTQRTDEVGRIVGMHSLVRGTGNRQTNLEASVFPKPVPKSPATILSGNRDQVSIPGTGTTTARRGWASPSLVGSTFPLSSHSIPRKRKGTVRNAPGEGSRIR